jgi:pantoate--beta-alanine ligase
MAREGEKDVNNIKMAVEKLILGHPFTKLDYINLCHPVTLEDAKTIEGETLLALAVWVGKTRLIDNRLIGTEDNGDQKRTYR